MKRFEIASEYGGNMFKGLVAAAFVVLLTVPTFAQQPTNKVGDWYIMLYPNVQLCTAHKVEYVGTEDETVIQFLAKGPQFTLQVNDPDFTYTVGDEFGVIIKANEENQYVRTEVMETNSGDIFLSSRTSVKDGAQLFTRLARADKMVLRYQDESYTYNLDGSFKAAQALLRCNASTVR